MSNRPIEPDEPGRAQRAKPPPNIPYILMNKTIAAFTKIIASFLLIAFVWMVFLLKYGDSVNSSLWGYYLLLCPLAFYLFFFASFFQLKRTIEKPSAEKTMFRWICIFFLVLAFSDGLGAGLNRRLYQQKIDRDERYNLYIHNWIQKRRFQIPPTSGDTEPGPFMPFVHGTILDSDVTADRWGFRRETPDPYPDLSLNETLNVLCLGGSVMFGMTTGKGDLPSPDMLQSILKEEINRPVRVFNAAFPGAHAGSITSPEQTAYWRIHPQILFFYEAVNWLAPEQKSFLQNRNSLLMTVLRNRQARRKSIEAAQKYKPLAYGKKLEQFIDQCQENDPDAVPVLMTFSLPFSENDSPEELSYWDLMQNGQGCAKAAAILVRKHNQKTIETARKRGIRWIDTRPLLKNKPKYFIDSCHLTQEGCQVLAQLMANCVLDVLHENTALSKD
ncbi:MAG: SGNH/GDSL hydrolase family protein [Candidatus Omnitrophica bacterium]|nr:SGNH/GDSL hydrolase family protein [Candidatus Omnitrophota bacterium]